jgi:hypothetical protein
MGPVRAIPEAPGPHHVADKNDAVSPTEQFPPPAGWNVPGPAMGAWGWPEPRPKAGTDRTGPLPLHPMSVSDILDGAFKILKGNFRTIALVAAVFVVPAELVVAVLQRASGTPNLTNVFGSFGNTPVGGSGETTSGGEVAALAAVLVIGLLITPFVAGAISRVVAASYMGTEEPPRRALRATFRRTWALFAAFVLVHVLEALGGVFCYLPGLAVMTMFVMVAPAIVIEGLGPIAGMRRSWRLAKGRFWGTLGICLLAALLTSVVSSALAMPFAIGGVLAGGAGWVLVAAGDILAGLVARPIVAVVATLQYYDARIRVEGYDIQVLTAALARDAA